MPRGRRWWGWGGGRGGEAVESSREVELGKSALDRHGG